MSDTSKCPRCRNTLPQDVSPDRCPTCLIRIGLEKTETGAETRTSEGDSAREAPQPADLERDFPHLEILEVLGQGGMGVVYKARQKSLDRLVALKILTLPSGAGPDFHERFAREARALASLAHPSIVSVHDFGKAGERYYLLMEYVDGANLHRMIHAGKIEPRQALEIVSAVCEALQFAHGAGVVHRDIKPENILVAKDGRIKIADFGLAKMLSAPGDELRLTGAGQVMGTAHYMAPEQLEHPLEVDHRADIYSLGVVFYELLTGELPLGRFQPPSRKVALDVRVDEVVLKTLEKEPQLRYQAVSQVKTDVDGISGTFRESKRARVADRSRAGWAPWAFAAAVLLVLALLIPVILLTFRDPGERTTTRAGAQRSEMALYEAAAQGRTENVIALLDAGVDINAKGATGLTALTQASDGGHADLVALLVSRGADVDAFGANHLIALSIAAAQGRLDIVETLLEAGADPNRGFGPTLPLWMAIDGGHHAVSARLLAAGADPDPGTALGKSNPLVLACARNDVRAARMLLEAGADADEPAENGDTVLIRAVESGNLELTRLLLDSGADPKMRGVGGRTAGTVAAAEGSPEMLELFRP